MLDKLTQSNRIRQGNEIDNDREISFVESQIQTLLTQIEKDQEQLKTLENQLNSAHPNEDRDTENNSLDQDNTALN